MFSITIDNDIELYLVQEHHHQTIFDLLANNREHIQEHLPIPSEDPEVTRQFTLSAMKDFAEKGDVQCHIYFKGQPAGMIGLHYNETDGAKWGEIGYWLGKAFVGNGIITRSAQALIDLGFSNYDYNRIIIRASTLNQRSFAVAERLGFKLDVIMRQVAYFNDQYVDLKLYSLLREEWLPPQQSPILRHRVNDKLDIRIVEMRHAETILAQVNANRDHLREWLGWVDVTNEVTDLENFVRSVQKQYSENNGFQAGLWYENQFVGMIGFHEWDFKDKKTEIGYWLAKEYTGKGVMTQAVRALCDFAINTLKLNRVVIRCAVGNERSCAVATRLGFRHEGVIRQSNNLNGKLIDMNQYALLAEEWKTT